MSTPVSPTPSAAAGQDEHDALHAGTRLNEFEILCVLGVGGFGIVYLAMDHALERQVAIKEYMPGSLAARGQGSQVSLRSASHLETFGIGLRSFVNEAKLLARFDNPSLVKVYRFWEANGTAYMVMPFYPGRTLKEERRALGQTPADEWLRGMVEPLLGALELLHREDVFHRDIAPDNILLTPGGPPVLLDFGAARRVIGDRTQTLTAILKPNFAPIEQYADVSHLRQGPWTDLYALGAVLHFAVTGKPPSPSAARAVHDELPLLGAADSPYAQMLTPSLLKAIDWALAVHPGERPQSVQQFRDALAGHLTPPERPVVDISMSPTMPADRVATAWAPTMPREPAAGRAASDASDTAFAPTMIAATVRLPASAPASVPHATPASEAPEAVPVSQRRSRRRIGWGVTAAGMVAVAVASWMLGARHEARQDPTGSRLAAAVAASAPVMAASAAAGPVVPPQAGVASAPVKGGSANTAVAVAEPKSKPVSRKPAHAARQSTVPAAAPVPERSEPVSPRKACGSRVFIAMMMCMRRECETARYRDHPQCQKLRREDEARPQGTN